MPYREKKRFSVIIKLLYLAGGIAIGFIVCRMCIVTFSMPDNSMEPNLRKGDIVVFLKHTTPWPGDIVLMDSPVEHGRVLVKRVVSAEGDTVEIKNKVFYINNKQFNFKWKHRSNDKRIFPMSFTYRDNMPVVKLGRKEFFVLSDHLDHGYDSRTMGLISSELIIGKMIYQF